MIDVIGYGLSFEQAIESAQNVARNRNIDTFARIPSLYVPDTLVDTPSGYIGVGAVVECMCTDTGAPS